MKREYESGEQSRAISKVCLALKRVRKEAIERGWQETLTHKDRRSCTGMDQRHSFVSGLGRTISPFLLLSRLEFLWTNRSLSSAALYPSMPLKVNFANRTLYILSRLSHRVCIKTSAVLVSHSPYTIRATLACSFSRLLKCVLLHDPQTTRPYVTDGNITFVLKSSNCFRRRNCMRRSRLSLDAKDFATFAT